MVELEPIAALPGVAQAAVAHAIQQAAAATAAATSPDAAVNAFTLNVGSQIISLTSNFVVSSVNSLIMILVTELGDKTFFIAAILAMRHMRLVVYSGAMGE